MLIKRVVTAAVALPVLLAALYFGGFAFAALAAGAAGVGAWELCRMAKAWGRAPFVPAIVVALAAGYALGGFWVDAPHRAPGLWLAASLVGIAVSAVALLRSRGGGDDGRVGRAAMALWIPLLVGGAMFHAVALRGQNGGAFSILFVLAAIVATDTGAYFVGRAFGKRKLAPEISPNKTWEGAVGGLLCAAIAGGAMLGAARFAMTPYVSFGNLNLTFLLSNVISLGLVAAILSVVGQFGDLYISKLKRKAGFDDSGSIFPGHGGILDRMDSLMFSVTAIVYLRAIVGGEFYI